MCYRVTSIKTCYNPIRSIAVENTHDYLFLGEFTTLLTRRYVEISILLLQFAEYLEFMTGKSPNLSKLGTLANFIQEGCTPEYLKQKSISQK